MEESQVFMESKVLKISGNLKQLDFAVEVLQNRGMEVRELVLESDDIKENKDYEPGNRTSFSDVFIPHQEEKNKLIIPRVFTISAGRNPNSRSTNNEIREICEAQDKEGYKLQDIQTTSSATAHNSSNFITLIFYPR